MHLDYGIHFSEYWKAQLAYDHLDTELRQEDNIPLLIASSLFQNTLNTTSKNSTYSGELTYNNVIDKHHVSLGLKGRVKKLDSLYVDKLGNIPQKFNKETILSAFIQDQYELSDKELLTLGVKYSNVSHNAIFDDDNLLQLRLGYLYNNDTWSYKAYLFRNMFTINPFSRYFSTNIFEKFDPQVTVGLTQELAYSDTNNDIRVMLIYIKEKNNLLNIEDIQDTKSFVSIFTYDYKIDTENKLNFQLGQAHYFDKKMLGLSISIMGMLC